MSQITRIKEVSAQLLTFAEIISPPPLFLFFFFSQVQLRKEYMKSTRAELQQNRKATVLPHHLKYRHKKCTMRWSNIKILPLPWELQKLGSCRARMSNFGRPLQWKIHLVKWMETAWARVPIPACYVVRLKTASCRGIWITEHKTTSNRKLRTHMCLTLALLPVSCSQTNKNISVAGKDEQAWLPSHGLNYFRGQKRQLDCW